MPTAQNGIIHYSIRQVTKLSGLPESTLRYYETIGLIDPIARDASSKQRVYKERDVNSIIGIACLNATGFSIDDMRQYLANRKIGMDAAPEQIVLLEKHKTHLKEELHSLEMRLKYVESKVGYWNAVSTGDEGLIAQAGELTYSIAREMKLPTSR